MLVTTDVFELVAFQEVLGAKDVAAESHIIGTHNAASRTLPLSGRPEGCGSWTRYRARPLNELNFKLDFVSGQAVGSFVENLHVVWLLPGRGKSKDNTSGLFDVICESARSMRVTKRRRRKERQKG